MHFLKAFALAGGVIVSCSPVSIRAPNHDLSHKTVYQFENNTWVENLAVRRNSKILATLITAAEVWEVDPVLNKADIVTRFPNASSTLGITELEPDVFAVVVGDWNPQTFEAAPGSWSVWLIDYSLSTSEPNVQKVSDLPSAGFLNGITTLPTQKHTVLIADSYQGIIYVLNTKTGAHKVAIDSPALKPNVSAVAKLGVNGIHFHEVKGQPFLYFTNSFKIPVLGRFALLSNGSAASAAEKIGDHPTYPTNAGGQADDFAFDEQGDIWLTTDPSNTLLRVDSRNSNVHIVAGGTDSSLIAGDTAVAFGRSKMDHQVLYVTTNGGMAYPPPSGIVGGKIVAFTLPETSLQA